MEIKRLDKSWYYYVAIMFMLLTIMFIFVLYPFIKSIINNRKADFLGILGIFVIGFLVFRGFFICIKLIYGLTGWKPIPANQWLRMVFAIVIMILGFFVVGCFLFAVKIFHNSFLLPDDLKNTEHLTSKIKLTNQGVKSFEIAYFNDKYIFVRVNDSIKKPFIQVINFNDLLDVSDSNK